MPRKLRAERVGAMYSAGRYGCAHIVATPGHGWTRGAQSKHANVSTLRFSIDICSRFPLQNISSTQAIALRVRNVCIAKYQTKYVQ